MSPAWKYTKYEYRRRLPHYQKDDRALFITFRKLTKEPLPEDERSIVLHHCLHDDGKRLTLHGVVVMPDHVHLLLTPLRNAEGEMFSLQEILHGLKGASARSINLLRGRSGPVWQDESFDHVLRSDESLKQKLEYIRQNPVRKGLVKEPEDYRWLWIEDERNTCGRALLPAAFDFKALALLVAAWGEHERGQECPRHTTLYCSRVPLVSSSSRGMTTAAATLSSESRLSRRTPWVERPASRICLVSMRMILP